MCLYTRNENELKIKKFNKVILHTLLTTCLTFGVIAFSLFSVNNEIGQSKQKIILQVIDQICLSNEEKEIDDNDSPILFLSNNNVGIINKIIVQEIIQYRVPIILIDTSQITPKANAIHAPPFVI